MQLPLCGNAYDDVKDFGFTNTQKSGYLENETLFFLQIKKIINYISSNTLWQKKYIYIVAEVTFNQGLK